MSIEVLDESGLARPAVPPLELRELAEHVLRSLQVHPGTDLCLTLVDETQMAHLHQEWMDLPGPTDVMSFPMDELRPGSDDAASGRGQLGDVVLCPVVARRQAEQAGHSTVDELLLLTTHGILHLLGFDHAEPQDEQEMFALQRTLLLTFLAERGRTTDAAPEPGARQ